ncbi:hypothetical protein TWF694_011467 [Orbilia ellipsospora]|uniref:Uncharacterized protein n=1 Tax=Orbilia ellipsospora TaxID=2528407 RepID=A0AAV9X5A5_9PEZI
MVALQEYTGVPAFDVPGWIESSQGLVLLIIYYNRKEFTIVKAMVDSIVKNIKQTFRAPGKDKGLRIVWGDYYKLDDLKVQLEIDWDVAFHVYNTRRERLAKIYPLDGNAENETIDLINRGWEMGVSSSACAPMTVTVTIPRYIFTCTNDPTATPGPDTDPQARHLFERNPLLQRHNPDAMRRRAPFW